MMTEKKIQLSALVDDELSKQELDEVLAYLKTDEAASQQLIDYQNISNVMRGYKTDTMSVDFSARLSERLDLEPTYGHQTESTASNVMLFPRKLWQQATSLAIAASLGALAVLGVMSQPQDALSPHVDLASSTVANDNNKQVETSHRWTVSEPEIEDRLNTYLVEHNEYAGASGVFSYARVVSYDTE